MTDGSAPWAPPPWTRHRPPAAVRDAGAPLLLAALLTLATTGEAHAFHGGGTLNAGGYLLVEGASLSLVLRRRLPPLALALSTAFAAAFLLLGFAPGPVLLAPFLGLLAYFASTDPRLLWTAAALVTAAVLSVAHGVVDGWGIATAVFVIVWLGVSFTSGVALDARRRFITEARARSRWVQRSREEASRRHLVEERLRIAREMHDVLGHSLAVITLQAGVAERFLETRPDEARRAVAAVRAVSRQALTELRSELAMLRGDDPAIMERSPLPDLTTVPALATQMADAGINVKLDMHDQEVAIPDLVSRAAYRIVQESLTNVARHAGPGTRVTVHTSISNGALHLAVSDDGAGRPADSADGAGIEGMRERVTSLGGSFAAENNQHADGFVVSASLPVSV